jgi:hypothetical protein
MKVLCNAFINTIEIKNYKVNNILSFFFDKF